MTLLLSLALRLAGLGASALGISAPAFALISGLALGAGPAGYVGFRIGHALGWSAGAADADKDAQINTLARDLAEAREDAANAKAASDTARADALRNAAAAALAGKRLDVYARDLARRGPGGACALSGADAARLLDNAWAREPGRRPAKPAAGR